MKARFLNNPPQVEKPMRPGGLFRNLALPPRNPLLRFGLPTLG